MSRTQGPVYETESEPFPSNLRDAMSKKHISQEELGKAAGVRRQTVSLYCSGQSKPTTETIAAIAKCLEVSADYLLGLTGDPTPKPDTAKDLGLSQCSIDELRKLSTSCSFPEESSMQHSYERLKLELIDIIIKNLSNETALLYARFLNAIEVRNIRNGASYFSGEVQEKLRRLDDIKIDSANLGIVIFDKADAVEYLADKIGESIASLFKHEDNVHGEH